MELVAFFCAIYQTANLELIIDPLQAPARDTCALNLQFKNKA
jgi:hypothetical protein